MNGAFGTRVRVVRLDEGRAADVAHLWRRCFPCREVQTQAAWNPFGGAMTRRAVVQRILTRDGFDPAGSFVALDGGRVVGVCLAAVQEENGYLCALAVEPSRRRRGIGSTLLARAERYVVRRGARRMLVTFEGNPVPLLLGVPSNYEGAPFLLNRGFRNYDRKFLQVMRQDTTRYRFPRAMRERIRRLEAKGVRIGSLAAEERALLDRLLSKHFRGWREGIMKRVNADPPAPVIAAVRKGRVLGFAGPFGVTSSGGGHFFALGVAPTARRQGIGGALFHRMCAELKAAGAKAVNLTTELDNPAQEIYASAGFRTRCVVDWGMWKDLTPLRTKTGRTGGKR